MLQLRHREVFFVANITPELFLRATHLFAFRFISTGYDYDDDVCKHCNLQRINKPDFQLGPLVPSRVEQMQIEELLPTEPI